MSIEVTRSGLRKRLGRFTNKPRKEEEAPESMHVSDLRVVHAEEHGDEERIHDEGEMVNENMVQSFSTISSEAGDSEHEYDLEHENQEEKAGGKERGGENGASPAIRERAQASKTAPKSPPRAVRRGTSSTRAREPPSSSSSTGSWIGYDLSIIVALVSPIGNILTGSDHIKNILLLLFLIYYLHQLVEVPWSLYRMSIPSEDSFTRTEDTEPAKLAAYSELQRLEFFYLVLTVLSPFVGATLLRYVAIAISGNPATLSWFSTLLFVLATGVRPWSHLVDRLKNRSRALKDLIEEPGVDEDASLDEEDPHEKIDRELIELRGKYETVDKRLADLDTSSSREWDDLSDAIDAVEASVRRYQSDANKKAMEWDKRLGVLETYVLDLHRRDRSTSIHENDYMRGARLRILFWDVLALPWTVTAFTWDVASRVVKRIFTSRHGVKRPALVGMDKPASPTIDRRFRTHVLETIAEEDPDADSQDRDNPGATQHGNGNGCIAGSDSSQTLVAETLHSNLKRREDLVELGISLVMRVLTIVFAPVVLFARALSALLELPRSVFRMVTQ